MYEAAKLSFGDEPSETFQRLEMPDGDVRVFREFFEPRESDRFLNELRSQINWKQDTIKMYGKRVNLPRLTAWYGDPGKGYSYSGITMEPDLWTRPLLEIKKKIDDVEGIEFNSVLVSLYRDGKDSLSWHQDNEPELGMNPIIASVSFGATRVFQFKHKYNKEIPLLSVDLTHGSLLIMKGTTQRFWVHQVPKTAKPVKPRINLTFRVIYDH